MGGSGFLGREIVRQAAGLGWQVNATYASRVTWGVGATWHRSDLRDWEATTELVLALRPDVIINTAYAQNDWAATATSAAHAASAAASAGSHLVYVSSDVVFGGSSEPYPETADPDPVTPYGAAKAAAETAVRAIVPSAAVVRTSLILGSDGESSHERRVHALARGEEDGVLYTDNVRCPVHVADLAAALLELATTRRPGVHHVAGPEATNRYELGLLVARRDGLDADALRPGLSPGAASGGPGAIRLDCTSTRSLLRTQIRPVSEFLAQPAGRSLTGQRPGEVN
jgi:dTDP-4-dehydrorhamnose reductase